MNLILPHERPLITSPFGMRTNGMHVGIDTIPYGTGLWQGITEKETKTQIEKRLKTNIMCIADGIIKFCGWLEGGGWTVVIDTQINGCKYRHAYSHLKENPNIKLNEELEAGEIIGFMGYSGVNYVNTHLHFSMVINPQLESIMVYREPRIFDPVTDGFFEKKYNTSQGVYELCVP